MLPHPLTYYTTAARRAQHIFSAVAKNRGDAPILLDAAAKNG